MRVFDNVFDKRFLDEFSHKLRYTTWKVSNTANRTTWPYGEKGTHRLLGGMLFNRKSIDIIEYNDDLELSYSAIEMFYAIQAHSKRRLYLEQIATNCQFMGMDGTNHTDVIDSKAKKEYSFILMLCDEIIDDNQGGEFINQTLEETVPFRYGRVIEFETHQLHRGMAFKIPNVARYSLKFVGKEIE